MEKYKKNIYDYYSSNKIYKLWPTNINAFEWRAPLFKKMITKYFPNQKDIAILDMGCGYGAFLYYLSKAGYENFIGIDSSVAQVNAARELGIKNVVLADIYDYLGKTKESTFDIVIAFDILEHFNKVELSGVVEECYRILKPGGLLITHQPNAEGPFGSYVRADDFTHEVAFTRISIAQLFLSSGFREARSYEDCPIPHDFLSLIRTVLWKCIVRQLYLFLKAVEGYADKDAILSINFITVAQK